MAATFQRECYTYNADDPSFALPEVLAARGAAAATASGSRKCVADEHYVPTVLAAHGLDAEVSRITFRNYRVPSSAALQHSVLIFAHTNVAGALCGQAKHSMAIDYRPCLHATLNVVFPGLPMASGKRNS